MKPERPSSSSCRCSWPTSARGNWFMPKAGTSPFKVPLKKWSPIAASRSFTQIFSRTAEHPGRIKNPPVQKRAQAGGTGRCLENCNGSRAACLRSSSPAERPAMWRNRKICPCLLKSRCTAFLNSVITRLFDAGTCCPISRISARSLTWTGMKRRCAVSSMKSFHACPRKPGFPPPALHGRPCMGEGRGPPFQKMLKVPIFMSVLPLWGKMIRWVAASMGSVPPVRKFWNVMNLI